MSTPEDKASTVRGNEDFYEKKGLLLVETSRACGRKSIEGITRYSSEQKKWNLLLCDQSAADRNKRWLNEWKGDGVIAHAFDKNSSSF